MERVVGCVVQSKGFASVIDKLKSKITRRLRCMCVRMFCYFRLCRSARSNVVTQMTGLALF